MYVIIDTNVLVVANGKLTDVSPECIDVCVKKLREIRESHIVVISTKIFQEYNIKVSKQQHDQPNAGDEFYYWLESVISQVEHCVTTRIRAIKPEREGGEINFREFPSNDPSLDGFDSDDKMFVATSLSHAQQYSCDPPVIFAARDCEWLDYVAPLKNHNIEVSFLCPDDCKGYLERKAIANARQDPDSHSHSRRKRRSLQAALPPYIFRLKSALTAYLPKTVLQKASIL